MDSARGAHVMMHREAEAMRNPFRSRPKSFLDSARRDWQLEAFAWLLRHSGGYPKFLETVPVLPIEEHFPDRGMTGHAGVAALFRRVRDHAGMAEWPCIVEPRHSDAGATGEHEPAAGKIRVIYYDPKQAEPTMLVAQFARELARYLVEHVEEAPPGGVQLQGPVVDLAAVFMGFGVFMANASLASTSWDLNEGELVHALALFCLLRRLEPGMLDTHLNPHLRKYLRLAALDLAQYQRELQRLRSVLAVVATDCGERSLATPAG